MACGHGGSGKLHLVMCVGGPPGFLRKSIHNAINRDSLQNRYETYNTIQWSPCRCYTLSNRNGDGIVAQNFLWGGARAELDRLPRRGLHDVRQTHRPDALCPSGWYPLSHLPFVFKGLLDDCDSGQSTMTSEHITHITRWPRPSHRLRRVDGLQWSATALHYPAG